MLTQGVPPEYVSLLKALYSHTTGIMRAYGQLSGCFETSSGVREGCPLSTLPSTVVEDVPGQALINSVLSTSTTFYAMDLSWHLRIEKQCY